VPAAEPKDLSPEEAERSAALEVRKEKKRLEEEALTALSARSDVHVRELGRNKRVFGIKDKHDKLAEATFAGGATFEPFRPREGSYGTKVMARNAWAARELSRMYQELLVMVGKK
jgi:hypothetical protein